MSLIFPWKDKILDYEIETRLAMSATLGSYPLEKIRFSITRLKRNEWHMVIISDTELEKIRFSITRLKQS